MISIYVPRIDSNISIEEIKNIFENVFNLGTIMRIECESNRRSIDYFYCYIFFSNWNNNEYANYILPRIQNNEPTRIFHPTLSKYWLVYTNFSDMSFYRDPIHMDLILYLHSDIRYETILSIIECLDIGKVSSIEMKNDEEEEEEQFVINNRYMRTQFKRNIVCIHFDYWYRSKSSYAFQKQITTDHYIEVNISQTVNRINSKILNKHFWTFYPETPKLLGINPNIWNCILESENPQITRLENALKNTDNAGEGNAVEENVVKHKRYDQFYVLPNRWNLNL